MQRSPAPARSLRGPSLTIFVVARRQAVHGWSFAFFGVNAGLAEPQAFAAFLAPLKRGEWVVHSKKPFGGPEAVLAYLSRYTHRVAISNHRLIAADAAKVSFKYKDYRRDGPERFKVMTLDAHAFIRRFLDHRHRAP